eukprot:TRINITY_DN30070_c0_g1_i2.p3 TRINITY_DN30070_c0_g1~~TRINITY_DN30070_c0_g1_i2.p3  ORF type:complete len:123 (-),score=36.53 TRINITY_DN30070_c0_g1_i2:57-425(-)
MLGDYYRYQAETVQLDTATSTSAEGRLENFCKSAELAYQEGMKEAKNHLLPTHPVRLQLALNFAVFLQSVMGETQAALEMASTALATAAGDLDTMPFEAHEDAEPHLTTLRAFIKTQSSLHD